MRAEYLVDTFLVELAANTVSANPIFSVGIIVGALMIIAAMRSSNK